MRSRKTLSRLAAIAAIDALLVTAMAGCDKGPTQPTPIDPQGQSQQQTTPAPPPQRVVSSVTISGATRLANPGDTTQLTAVARYTDGTTRDVTGEANWGPPGARIFTVRQGLVTAIAYGTADVVVTLASWGPMVKAGIRVHPEGTFLLKGRVTEQGGFTVADATVRVTSGSQTFTARADILGYVLPAAGDTTLTVEKAAYATQAKRLVVQDDQEVNVELQRADRDSFGGVYTLTLSASASCTTLPPEAMRRRYYARISAQTDGSLIVDLSGADFFGMLGEPGFTGQRDANRLHFDLAALAPGFSPKYVVLEVLDPSTFLGYSGTAEGTIAGTSLVATLDGTISVTALQDGSTVSCKASDHRLEFVPSGT